MLFWASLFAKWLLSFSSWELCCHGCRYTRLWRLQFVRSLMVLHSNPIVVIVVAHDFHWIDVGARDGFSNLNSWLWSPDWHLKWIILGLDGHFWRIKILRWPKHVWISDNHSGMSAFVMSFDLKIAKLLLLIILLACCLQLTCD